MRKILLIGALLVIGVAMSNPQNVQHLKNWFKNGGNNGSFNLSQTTDQKIISSEESVITKVVSEAIPSVVTVSIHKTTQTGDSIQFDPFSQNPFQTSPGQTQNIDQNIGSGFIVTSDGLIITNKHVVADTQATYQIMTNDKKNYNVKNIYRDPLNDLAILKIDAPNLQPLKLGDSLHLKLGQIAVAIGTPLGEFTNTVTSGIVSGLGRGITAGSPYEGFVEQLDNVIQTDAAINPGNSGGPLINSSGEAIGINTAVSQNGQNLAFAIPINTVVDLLKNFNESGGKIVRPYMGIRYKMLDRQTAVLNNLPAGAYIIEAIKGSPADIAGLQANDVITKIDNQQVDPSKTTFVQSYIATKKVGDTMQVTYFRGGKTSTTQITLQNFQ